MKAMHLFAPAAMIAQPVLADCKVSEGFTFASKKGVVTVSTVRIDAVAGLILRYKATSEINTDGSPISYNLDGTHAGALNTMCNGTNAILADKTVYSGVVTNADKATASYKKLDAAGRKAFGKQKCVTLLRYFADARQHGFDPAYFPRMDFYAVARDPAGKPCLLPEGFLVSQTSALADPSIADNCNPAKWLDPLTISAVVMPRNSLFVAYPGYAIDAGNLVLARTSGAFVPAVVGDEGPRDGLGEITPELGWRLNGVTPDPSTLPLSQVKALLPRAHLSAAAEYFVFTQASVAYAPGAFPGDPKKRKAVAINAASIKSAFDRLGREAVETDLKQCVFPN